jgi:hypothetical protein
MNSIDLSSQLADAKLRLQNIRRNIDESTAEELVPEPTAQLSSDFEATLREVLELTRKVSVDPTELAYVIAELCSTVAGRHPDEALRLASEINADVLIQDKRLEALVADALHIAYRCLGDAVRADQNRAIALRFRRDISAATGAQISWQGQMAALRSFMTPLADSKKESLELSENLDAWLATKDRISLNDLAPSFGRFVSNDRQFYREGESRSR